MWKLRVRYIDRRGDFSVNVSRMPDAKGNRQSRTSAEGKKDDRRMGDGKNARSKTGMERRPLSEMVNECGHSRM